MKDKDQANFFLYKIEQFLKELGAQKELDMLRFLSNYITLLETEYEQTITLKERENAFYKDNKNKKV